LLLPPHYPRTMIDQITYVWMEDFGVGHLGFGNSSVCAAQEHPHYKTCCTVDLGWSSSIVVPTFRKQAIHPEAIRRLPIGGRHLVNVLKYYMSYRQYNLMDQEHLLKDILHQLLFVSLDFKRDLELARRKPSGRRIYDRDFVLPDYQTRSQGQVRIPSALQQELSAVNTNGDENEDDEDQEDDEDYEMEENDDDPCDTTGDGGVQETEFQEEEGDESVKSDEEEKTIEQRRQVLLRQRAEEEKRRREQAEEEQVLRLSVERFTVPEILFRPADAGFPQELVGLGSAIVQAIQACPEHFHAALYQSIHLVGGVSKIQNLKMRVENEVRELASSEYRVKVSLDCTPIERGWLGAKTWVSHSSHTDCMISRDEWLMAGKRKAYTRLLSANGGACV
jgi:actin-related protein 6